MVKQKIMPPNSQVRQTHLSRLYFLSKGCKQVPLESAGGKVLWANPDEGYFMSAYGNKIELCHSPSNRRRNVKGKTGVNRGRIHPILRHFGGKSAHRVMFETFAEEPCPIFFDSKGNPYKGIVHHVIENPNDIRMDNLMGWLTYKQHAIADKRRGALEAVLPDMYCVETKYLKTLQDPHISSDEEFARMMAKYEQLYEQEHGPLFKRFDALYRSTVLRSTRITREERARAKAVWDHMTPDQRTTIIDLINHHPPGILLERMDYTLSNFVTLHPTI